MTPIAIWHRPEAYLFRVSRLSQPTSELSPGVGGYREVDLIVEGVDGRVVGVEVKLSPEVAARDVRHLVWLRDRLPDRVADLVVVTTGTTAYRRSDGVAVVPLALLGS